MGTRLVGLPVFPMSGGLPPQHTGALALVVGAQGRGVRLHLGEAVRRLAHEQAELWLPQTLLPVVSSTIIWPGIYLLLGKLTQRFPVE